MTTKMTDTAAARRDRRRHPRAAPARWSAPTPPAWPRSRNDPSRATSRSSPRCSPPRSTTAPNDDANDASTKPASRGSNASPTSTSTPRPPSTRRPSPRSPSGAYLDAGEPVVLLGDSGTGKSHLLIGLGHRRLRTRTPRPLRHRRAARQRTRRSRRRTTPVTHRRPLRPPRPALPRRARLRPTRRPRQRAAVPDPHRTRRESLHRRRLEPAVQRMGQRSSPTPASSPPSSTGSPSTPTSSRPAPTATGCARHADATVRKKSAVNSSNARTLHPSRPARGAHTALQRPAIRGDHPDRAGGAKSSEHGGASLG